MSAVEKEPTSPIPEIVLLAEYRSGKGSDSIAAQYRVRKSSVVTKLLRLGVRRDKSAAFHCSHFKRPKKRKRPQPLFSGDWTGTLASLREEARAARRTYQMTAMERYYADHERNKKRLRATARTQYSTRFRVDTQFTLKRALRNTVSRIAREIGTSRRTLRKENLLGCSYDIARRHIESQWEPGMSWANHGAWHIDHILPLDAFDLTSPYHRVLAAHYTNLRPLWARENRTKHAKVLHKFEL